MARLIPSFMDDHTPPGEHDVFNMLAAGPADWVALHSLDLAPWNHGLRTEIDFLVIVPDAGILCLEVKSYENILFAEDRWYPQDIKRSPFKQASDGRYTFHRRLVELAPQFKRLPVVHCCIFPRAPFDLPRNLSVQPWELMDARIFRVFETGAAFCAVLRTKMQEGIAADANITSLEHPLSRDQTEMIVKYCLPVQKRRPEAREELRRREQQIEAILRAQQKPVLQLAELNERVVISGGAGTGKTLIAMEVARRAAEKGHRVALLSFNQLVGDWMKHKLAQSGQELPNLVIGPAIRILAGMTGLEIPENPSRHFWEAALPQRLEEKLTDPDFKAGACFDYLVLDEAQDFLARPSLWGCLTHFLTGGLEHGACALFGDFANQVLAERGVMDQTLSAIEHAARPARWRLGENCRNYQIIGDTAVALSGLKPPVYSGYLRAGGTVSDYDIFFYEHERAQLDKLSQWLREFKALGYKPSEITLLSFRASDDSAAVRLKQEGFHLRPFWQNGEFTGFTTIHAFKGLENKIIILTDVALGEPEFHRQLFYTGITRTTGSIRILCDINSRETLLGWITPKPDL